MKYTVTLVGNIVLILVQIIESNTLCNKEAIDKMWKKCDDTYLVSSVRDMTSMRNMCESVECLVHCKTNAVGDCANREEFREHLFEFDPQRWKVYYRFTCSSLDAVQDQFNGRCKDNKICSQENMTNFNPREKDKNLLCSSLKTMRKCSSMSADPDQNCTVLGAKFQEDIHKLGYSVSICENTDIKDLYTKYGGPDKCGSSSGTARFEFLFSTVSLFMIFGFLFHFTKF